MPSGCPLASLPALFRKSSSRPGLGLALQCARVRSRSAVLTAFSATAASRASSSYRRCCAAEGASLSDGSAGHTVPVRSRCEQADQDSGAGVEQNTAEESLAGCTDLSMRGKRRNIQISAKTEHRMPFHPGNSALSGLRSSLLSQILGSGRRDSAASEETNLKPCRVKA